MKKRCSSGKKGRGFFGKKGEREGEEKKERKGRDGFFQERERDAK